MSKQDTNQNDESSLFPKKWDKIIREMPEFKEIADAASADDLKKIILLSEGNIYTIEKEKDSDVKLNAARELVSEHSAPYRDAAKVQMAKIKYSLFLLEGKGVEIGTKE